MGKDGGIERELNLTLAANYSGARVLITGIGGFLGGSLATRLLKYGAHVWGLFRDFHPYKNYSAGAFKWRVLEDVIAGDLRDYLTCERAVAESYPHIIFHCGAMTQVGHSKIIPLQSYQTNVMGTVNLLEALRKICWTTPIVVASSDKAYGEPLETPVNEHSAFNPVHPYDASKAAADLIARSYGKYYDMNVAITRCGNIYGPGDTNWQRLIPGIFRNIIRGEPPLIRSDGRQVRDYNYIDDIVDAYLLIGARMGHVNFNGDGFIISADQHWDVLQMVEKMCKTLSHLNPLMPVIQGQAQDETKHLIVDGSRFAEEFDWKPRVSLDDGLCRTADWLRSYLRSE